MNDLAIAILGTRNGLLHRLCGTLIDIVKMAAPSAKLCPSQGCQQNYLPDQDADMLSADFIRLCSIKMPRIPRWLILAGYKVCLGICHPSENTFE
jgi:hypothetical protein